MAPAHCTGTGSTAFITGDGELTANAVVIDSNTGTVFIPTGSGTLSMTQPQTGSSASLTCQGAGLVLTVVPLAVQVLSGSCDGEMTAIVPGVGTARITGETGAVAFTIDPVPVLTIVGPSFTVEVSLLGGATQTVSCSAVTVNLGLNPILTIPQNLCT